MPEIALTQAPAHIRQGSSIGQPLTDGLGDIERSAALG